MSTEKHPLFVWNEMMRIEWPHERHTRNTQDCSGHDFNLASIQLLFSFYIFWHPRGAAVVTVPVCIALALLNQGKGSIVLDLGSIYPAILKAMGRMCGKRQQYCCFGNMEQHRTGCVVKLGITTGKRGKTAGELSNLSIIYVASTLKRGKCTKK